MKGFKFSLQAFSVSAFTLVETLSVVAIIGVLVFFAAPALLKSKSDSQKTAAEGTLWTINVGLIRAYKDKDPQTEAGGVLSLSPSATGQYPDVTQNALAYLIERGYVR